MKLNRQAPACHKNYSKIMAWMMLLLPLVVTESFFVVANRRDGAVKTTTAHHGRPLVTKKNVSNNKPRHVVASIPGDSDDEYSASSLSSTSSTLDDSQEYSSDVGIPDVLYKNTNDVGISTSVSEEQEDDDGASSTTCSSDAPLVPAPQKKTNKKTSLFSSLNNKKSYNYKIKKNTKNRFGGDRKSYHDENRYPDIGDERLGSMTKWYDHPGPKGPMPISSSPRTFQEIQAVCNKKPKTKMNKLLRHKNKKAVVKNGHGNSQTFGEYVIEEGIRMVGGIGAVATYGAVVEITYEGEFVGITHSDCAKIIENEIHNFNHREQQRIRSLKWQAETGARFSKWFISAYANAKVQGENTNIDYDIDQETRRQFDQVMDKIGGEARTTKRVGPAKIYVTSARLGRVRARAYAWMDTMSCLKRSSTNNDEGSWATEPVEILADDSAHAADQNGNKRPFKKKKKKKKTKSRTSLTGRRFRGAMVRPPASFCSGL